MKWVGGWGGGGKAGHKALGFGGTKCLWVGGWVGGWVNVGGLCTVRCGGVGESASWRARPRARRRVAERKRRKEKGASPTLPPLFMGGRLPPFTAYPPGQRVDHALLVVVHVVGVMGGGKARPLCVLECWKGHRDRDSHGSSQQRMMMGARHGPPFVHPRAATSPSPRPVQHCLLLPKLTPPRARPTPTPHRPKGAASEGRPIIINQTRIFP